MEVLELEKKAAQPEFWNNQEEAQSILQKRSRLERDIQLDAKLTRDVEDLKALAELAAEGEDVLSELSRAKWKSWNRKPSIPKSACCFPENMMRPMRL